ncbi:class I SAM-dependent methyltransferase [Sulfitobacter mediterraneus]|uniref:class I SAM-dependent methyltransferase n=1 Tax=Sulfitobacter mediterraneus TaxID=83219 RepID=UPI0019315761|nr:class I SAM-dependent methyltransferase [Sulfitobacter mediterraneus]MBM1632512.1 class I SAM-dependent methyltransferase [Sulfitobacter mediterraneus]MBM1640329.1 class I SAM-dependent methyltransferase [Sulfitobacter mediterraneus]MBM1644377.1 class I SAM-dependent methyltransferase [Sulfitobacter mediterraneus]MBM1648424.1 class I SAM-dependent methyltransferase [Sulfitobacter mediterraneus]MBM1652469.1 class I SAM-dependent methyltransferase [Sulfitobacter mediterraneus]
MTNLTKPHPESRFWNRMAPGYARSTISDVENYERKLRETAALMRPDMQVLEIGCGTGSTALWHAPNVAHITATDLSSGMLDIAREKARTAAIENVTFVEAAAEDVPQPDRPYDMIMAHSLLHLVKDHREVITNMANMLAPGGFLVTSTICMSEGLSAFKLIAWPGRILGLLPRINFLRKRDLEDAVQDAGLKIHTCWRPGKRKAVFLIARKPA